MVIIIISSMFIYIASIYQQTSTNHNKRNLRNSTNNTQNKNNLKIDEFSYTYKNEDSKDTITLQNFDYSNKETPIKVNYNIKVSLINFTNIYKYRIYEKLLFRKIIPLDIVLDFIKEIEYNYYANFYEINRLYNSIQRINKSKETNKFNLENKLFLLFHINILSFNTIYNSYILFINSNNENLIKLSTYINYTIVYDSIKAVSEVLVHSILNDANYKEEIKSNLSNSGVLNAFSIQYLSKLEQTTFRLFKEGNNIKTSDTTIKMSSVLLINDYNKTRQFFELSFYQIFFYIFKVDENSGKIYLDNKVVEYLKESERGFDRKRNIRRIQISKIENSCQNIFDVFIEESENMIIYNWDKNITKCVFVILDAVMLINK